MSSTLDRLVAREIGRLFAAAEAEGCGCSACRAASPGWDDEAAEPRRKGAPRQTRAGSGGRAMPAWRGWSPPVSLADIQQAQKDQRAGKPVAAHLKPFLGVGQSHVYRLTRAGVDRARPLTIGMTQDTRSIAQRVGQHYGTTRGDPQVHAKIKDLDPRRILVQAGQLSGRPDIRQTHGYEIWLQGRERPLIYEPDTRTFDESAR